MINSEQKELIMFDRDTLNEMATRISEALPEPARKMQKQFKNQVEEMITQGLKDLKVVTREDFERQNEKLSKAEAKLAELEIRITQFEKTNT